MVQELIGVASDKINLSRQGLCICLILRNGAANKEWAASLAEHTLHPVENSRHVKAEENFEDRLQLLCGCIAIGYIVLLPIFTSNIQCEDIDDVLSVTHYRRGSRST